MLALHNKQNKKTEGISQEDDKELEMEIKILISAMELWLWIITCYSYIAGLFLLIYHCLSSSLTFISKIPSLFWPDPSPPSPQKLSFYVCSTNFRFPVASNFSLRSPFCVNLCLSPSYIASSFTSSQSFLKGNYRDLPNWKESKGVLALATVN